MLICSVISCLKGKFTKYYITNSSLIFFSKYLIINVNLLCNETIKLSHFRSQVIEMVFLQVIHNEFFMGVEES